MTSITLLTPNRTIKATALVIATRSANDVAIPVVGSDVADDLLGGQLLAALGSLRAKGHEGEVVQIPVPGDAGVDVIVAVGLGRSASGADVDGLDLEAVRRAVGVAVRTLAGTTSAVVSIGAPDGGGADGSAADGSVADGGPAAESVVGAIAEGVGLGAYAYQRYKTGAVSAPVSRVQIRAVASATNRTALARAAAISTAVTTVRDWVNLAPVDLYPQSFAELATTYARAAGCTVQVLDERALRRGNYGGVLAVGSGSARPPRLIRVTYRPQRPRTSVALVGKGITYDSGGYSLKVPQSGAMKGDMAGAANVLATVVLAAQLKLPVAVTATAALAENLVSGTGFRVGDVLTMRNGSTVEVDNTDAEGRLVLADAITRASEDDPDYLIETSTLTGAAVVALGQRTAGVMGSADLRDVVVAAAEAVGEPAWPMPLPRELRAGIDSPVADLRNVSGQRYGGMLVAGLFLAEFVPDGLPWAHIDIAGPSFNDGNPWGYTPKGGTGYGVRTLLATLERLAR
jgi:leucyl aminopeptidase